MTSLDPLSIDEALVVARASNRELYAMGYKFCEQVREQALEVLADEVERLRHELMDCPTCEGTGVMSVCVEVLPPDYEEVIQDETCAECGGNGKSGYARLQAEVERLGAENEGLRNDLDCGCSHGFDAGGGEHLTECEWYLGRVTRERVAADAEKIADLETEVEHLRAEALKPRPPATGAWAALVAEGDAKAGQE